MTKLTQALPVSPVYSISVPPSLPPTTGSDRDSTQRPAFGMTIQSQQLDSGQKTMPGLLPGAFGDQWRELGLFTSTSFTFKIITAAFSTIGALCVFGVGPKPTHVLKALSLLRL